MGRYNLEKPCIGLFNFYTENIIENLDYETDDDRIKDKSTEFKIENTPIK